MNIEELVTRFHLDAEDFQLDHCGHDLKISGNIVKFIGSWEASHEAWLFGEWLNDNGYSYTVSANEVGIAQLPDVPDWASVELANPRIAKIEAMGVSVRTGLDDIDSGIEELKRKMWKEVSDVQGVGRKMLEAMKAEFETPIHGVGSFKDVDGVGSKTAELLNDRVMANG